MKKLVLFTVTILILSTSCKKEKEPENVQPVTSIGATYAGGTVFYLDADGQHGLTVTDDLGEFAWYEGNEFAINTTSYEFGEGLNNTNEIILAQGSGSYAAKACNDLVLNGYNDWYLPSNDELKTIVINYEDTGVDGFYWSSTESVYPNMTYGWYQKGGLGVSYAEGTTSKTNTLKVRAVRNF